MSKQISEKKVTKANLALATIGVFGGVALASFIAFEYDASSTQAAPAISQSLNIESEKLKNTSPTKPNEVKEEVLASGDLEAPQTADSDTLVIEWVEGMTWLDLLTEEERNYVLGNGSSRNSQSVDNTSKKVTVAPAPRNAKTSDESAQTGGVPQTESENQQPSPANLDCYGQYEAACKAGFVAPTVEYAGYLSCQKLEDGTVRLKGLVRLVGGNYKYFSWNGQTHNGMLVVSSRVSEWPYVISWSDARATFHSMDDRYQGIIGEAGGHGSVLLDDSQIDPSCRF